MNESTPNIDPILAKLLKAEKAQLPQTKLERALAPYADFWEEWLASSGCFLTAKEKVAVVEYKKSGKHTSAADKLRLSTGRVAEIFKTALRRLVNNEHLYRHWIANKIVEDAGIVNYNDPKAHFLTRPMHEHHMSKALYMLLSMEAENIEELLSIYAEDELLEIHGFGNKKMEEFKAILKANQCLDQLR